MAAPASVCWCRNDESLAEVGRAIAEAPDDPGALLAGAQDQR
ncbi:MAG: hypothetical protein R2862_02280 [Thermoanaerobaculia bacterium]